MQFNLKQRGVVVRSVASFQRWPCCQIHAFAMPDAFIMATTVRCALFDIVVSRIFFLILGIDIRAQTSIQEGEEITIQYQSLFSGSRKRREKFRDVWFFDCHCVRCQDPSELKSFLNAFQCHACKGTFFGAKNKRASI